MGEGPMRMSFVILASLVPLAAVIGGAEPAPAPRLIDGRFAPYSSDPAHPRNQLPRALFVRDAREGGRRTHLLDPLLYRGGSFLFAGESHTRAIALLDRFEMLDDPLKRLVLQRDLW